MIDSMGQRYGMLPSRVLCEADSFDVYIMDAALSYEKYMHDKEMRKHNKMPGDVNLSQDQLLEGLDKFKKGLK
jgi:hypothetical protein